MAHVALTNDTSLFGILWNVEGALEDAVRTTDALVVKVTNNSGVTRLLVSLHRASVETLWVGAVVAGSGDGLLPTGFAFAS
jgi:hypothetical protein